MRKTDTDTGGDTKGAGVKFPNQFLFQKMPCSKAIHSRCCVECTMPPYCTLDALLVSEHQA